MNFTTPVGRLVQGDLFRGNDKDKNGQPYIIKTGPNKGSPTTKYYFAVAFPKVLQDGSPNTPFIDFFKSVIDVARSGYPSLFAGPIDSFTGKPGCTHPRMTYKITDGDGVDNNGVSNATKEGWAGHWIVKFNGNFPPKCFEYGKFLPEQQLTSPSQIKIGDFAAVSGTVEPNIGSDVPGVYMNGNLVALMGSGPAIVSGPNATEAFANLNVAALPAGCVVGATPASMPPAAPVAPVAPVAPAAPAVAITPVGQAAGLTLANIDAWRAGGWTDASLIQNGYISGPAPATPVAPAAPAVPAVPAGLTLTAAGASLGTLESFRANNWTDDMLISQGYATR